MGFWKRFFGGTGGVITASLVGGTLLGGYLLLKQKINDIEKSYSEASKDPVVQTMYDSSAVVEKHLNFARDVESNLNATLRDVTLALEKVEYVQRFFKNMNDNYLISLQKKGWMSATDAEGAKKLLSQADALHESLQQKQAQIMTHTK